jgi:hypothetical protein
MVIIAHYSIKDLENRLNTIKPKDTAKLETPAILKDCITADSGSFCA